MRVPPEVLSGSTHWQFPLTTLLLAMTVIVTGLVSGFDPTAGATQSNKVSKRQVIVARRTMNVGDLIEQKDLTLSVLPVESVPVEAFTSVVDATGWRAGTYIPEGMPLSAGLLSDDVEERNAVLAASESVLREGEPK